MFSKLIRGGRRTLNVFALLLVERCFLCFLCSQYVFADVTNKYIFTTRNYGRTFSRIQVDFRPREISMHSSDPDLILAYDKDIKRVSEKQEKCITLPTNTPPGSKIPLGVEY